MKNFRTQKCKTVWVIVIAFALLLLSACNATSNNKQPTLTAKFDDSHKVTENDTLDSIKRYFTVIYTDQNGISKEVYDFSISGQLIKGQRAITIMYDNLLCREIITVVAEEIAVVDVIINNSSLSLKTGESKTLSATVLPSNASNQSISWSSSNSHVATINNGVVRALNNGNAIITATSSNGISAACSITVTTAVENITLNYSSLSLKIGESKTLSATVLPSNASNRSVSWSSSDSRVATINNGVVKALNNGNAIISATSSNGISATCSITVTTDVENIILDNSSLSLNVGESQALSATVFPSNASDQSISWSSSDSSVASVNNGVVTALYSGSAIITATSSNGISATCSITVTTDVENIILDNSSLSLNVGERQTLSATVFPSNASDQRISWSSSDSSVASVNNGVVTALYSGSAIITATSSNGIIATCSVTVTPAIENIILDNSSLSLKVGESHTLSATILPANALNQSVFWSSSNSYVATVNNGVVTALNSGSTTITATCSNGISATCSVTVWKPYTDLKISKSFLRINVGETYTFQYSYAPRGASEKVVLKTRNANLVDIGEHGLITAKAVGKTSVYLESQSGLISECAVQVVNIKGIDDIILSSRDTSPARSPATAKLFNIDFVFRTETSATVSRQYIDYAITLTKTSFALSNDPSVSRTFVIKYKIYDSNDVIVGSGSITSPSFCVGETVRMSGSIGTDWNDAMPIGTYRIELSGLS